MTKNISHSQKKLFSVPFCLFIGPQRAGTSWLYRYLISRGDVCLPLDIKEIFFFDHYFDRGADFYKSHFKVLPEHLMAMEITTTSFNHTLAPQRIYDLFGPNIRLICPLRDPVVRSYSLYKHFVRYGMVKGEIEAASLEMPEIIETSRYAKYLKNWFDVFGRDNIYFSFQEDLAKDQDGYVRHICNCLDIPYVPVPEEISGKHNATRDPPSFFIANVAQKFSNILRSLKLYAFINFAKKLGLKQLIFGKANPDAESFKIPAKDKDFLEKKLFGEIEKLEELLGFEIQQWKE